MQGTGTAALERHFTEYNELIDDLEKLEHNANSAEEYFSLIERLAPLHRAAGNMHAVFQDARKLGTIS